MNNNEESVDEDTKGDNMVYCNCGTHSMLTIFECVVIAAIEVFFFYVTVALMDHCRSFYLKRREEAEMVKQQNKKFLRQKLSDEIDLERQADAAGSSRASQLNTDFS